MHASEKPRPEATTVERRQPSTSPGQMAAERAPVVSRRGSLELTGPPHLIRLQRLAGNRATATLLARSPAVQRMRDPAVTNEEGYGDAVAYINQHRIALLTAYKGLIAELTTVNITDQEAIAKAVSVMNFANMPAAARNLAEVLLTGGAVPPLTGAALRQNAAQLAVRVLNSIEQELATRAVVTKADVRDVLVGTEFSFSDGRAHTVPEASINLKLDPKTADQRRAHTSAKAKIIAWTSYARTKRDEITGTPTVTVEDKPDAKAPYAKKVTYTFAKGSWYWVADIDEGCFETQTLKTRTQDVGAGVVREIIEKHIFAGATSQGLRADREATGATSSF